MSFGWQDFETLAREVLDGVDESTVPEAAVRTALGRSYYAVFGVARDMLRARGVNLRRESEHAGVRRALSNSADVVEQQTGAALAELFRWRAIADYDARPALPLTRELAEHAYLVSRSSLSALRPQRADDAEEHAEPDAPQDRP